MKDKNVVPLYFKYLETDPLLQNSESVVSGNLLAETGHIEATESILQWMSGVEGNEQQITMAEVWLSRLALSADSHQLISEAKHWYNFNNPNMKNILDKITQEYGTLRAIP